MFDTVLLRLTQLQAAYTRRLLKTNEDIRQTRRRKAYECLPELKLTRASQMRAVNQMSEFIKKINSGQVSDSVIDALEQAYRDW